MLEKPRAQSGGEFKWELKVANLHLTLHSDFHLPNGEYSTSWQNARVLDFRFREGPRRLARVCLIRDSLEP